MARLRILHLDDDLKDLELIGAALAAEIDCEIEAVSTREAFSAALARGPFEVILLDYKVPGFDALAALELARERFPDTAAIIVSGTIGEELAVETVKHGAYDYILKDHLARLPSAVLHAVEDSRMRTAHLDALERLRVSEERFRNLIEHLPAVTYTAPIADPEEPGALPPTVATYVSPQFLDLVGIPAEEYLADPRPITQYVHPDDRDRVMREITQAWEGRQRRVVVEYRLSHRDGRSIWVRNQASVFTDPADGSMQIQGFIVDITETKNAQEELRQAYDEMEFRVLSRTAELATVNESLSNEVTERRFAEARLDRALMYAPLPMMLHAEDGCVLLLNKRWTKITGYSPADIPTIADWTEKAYGQRKDLVRSYIDHVYDIRDATDEGEDTITTHDGVSRIWDFSSAPLGRDSSGRKLVITMAMDVTERAQAERDLASAREAAESASVAKTHFLANMSHELRTPLGTIIGFSQLLQEKLFGDLNPKQEEQVNHVLEAARHLLSLINDILDLSKIEAGKMELKLSELPLANLLAGSLSMLKGQCLKKGVTLDLVLEPEAQAIMLTADERMLKQVMYNLLSNATKFTPRDGTITVSARTDGDQVVVSVADTGIGIAPEKQQTVFEEFYQVQSGYSEKTPGTGLGLTLVAQMVDIHGGRVWVESEGIGKGSTFSFALPLTGPVEPGSWPPAEPSSPEELQGLIDTLLSRREQACLCWIEPNVELSGPTNHEAVLQSLHSAKREDDVVLLDDDNRYVLVFTNADRERAKAGCRRIAELLESSLAVSWRWAAAVFPDDGQDSGTLLDVLKSRIGG
ncbi:MAG: hypothetical protein C0418_00460 [Coriobacteriaceae bacterium]|nr:hypothetical protein [Coriobacteriaceae bacterium]